MMNRVKAPVRPTAASVLTTGQVLFFSAVLILIAYGIYAIPVGMAKLAVLFGLAFFTVFVGMKMLLWYMSAHYRFPVYQIPGPDDTDLPHYAVFIPMFRESRMVDGMIRGLEALEYPKDKLHVMLLVETPDRDPETRRVIDDMALPAFVHVIEVPDVKPYGKQKALNWGLAQARKHARENGFALEYCVIYDAEDRPEPQQLLKAVGAFRYYKVADPRIVCVQSRLHFSNQSSSWVSRLMWVEYIIHFEWVLPGFAKLGLIPPLGGTSNHFLVDALMDVRIPNLALPAGARGDGAWDPWNVTEDADLAGALARGGYRIAMLDSYTMEVATIKMKALVDQRSRWLKGYIQTALLFTRKPLRTMRQMGPVRWFFYVLFLGGTPLSILLSALSWALTICYFITRSPAIELLFPFILLYLGAILLVFGNFALFVQHVAASNKRDGFGTVPYITLVLVGFWQMLTLASLFKATMELLHPKQRHFWNKTEHGHDLHTLERVPESANVGSSRTAPANVIPLQRPTAQGEQAGMA